ncbi:dnaJ homolog subfamily B member 5 [Sergentomyia squamirostris]
MLKFSNLRQSLPKIQCFPKFYSMSTTPSGFRETRRIPEKNYYKILGVGACSSGKEIKTAYIRLAKIYHPDTSSSHSQEAKNHFQDIAEAYEVLSDRQKRRLYDKFVESGLQGLSGNPGGENASRKMQNLRREEEN